MPTQPCISADARIARDFSEMHPSDIGARSRRISYRTHLRPRLWRTGISPASTPTIRSRILPFRSDNPYGTRRVPASTHSTRGFRARETFYRSRSQAGTSASYQNMKQQKTPLLTKSRRGVPYHSIPASAAYFLSRLSLLACRSTWPPPRILRSRSAPSSPGAAADPADPAPWARHRPGCRAGAGRSSRRR